MSRAFVFDTNALVSAHLIPTSVNRIALDRANQLGVLVYSHDTLGEFRRVFAYARFDRYHTLEKRMDMVDLFARRNQLIQISERIAVCRDATDDMFLEVALSAQALAIITGDPDLRVLHPFRGIPILSPADFLKAF